MGDGKLTDIIQTFFMDGPFLNDRKRAVLQLLYGSYIAPLPLPLPLLQAKFIVFCLKGNVDGPAGQHRLPIVRNFAKLLSTLSGIDFIFTATAVCPVL